MPFMTTSATRGRRDNAFPSTGREKSLLSLSLSLSLSFPFLRRDFARSNNYRLFFMRVRPSRAPYRRVLRRFTAGDYGDA